MLRIFYRILTFVKLCKICKMKGTKWEKQKRYSGLLKSGRMLQCKREGLDRRETEFVMKKLVIGILAHVDAGKTTLSEALLFESGSIRKMGRVDKKDAFLDTDIMEKERGITIFSKQAVFSYGEREITLLDTPGHVDFSAEMERTLQVLDYAVLVVSGTDGVQAHTETLWRLLTRYQVPVFLFINKMDQPDTDREKLLCELQKKCHENCLDFGGCEDTQLYENLAVCEEGLLEQYLTEGKISKKDICRLIRERKVFPCFFGSALRMEGVDSLLAGLAEYAESPYETKAEDAFKARVFKIARDVQGNRLTWLKVTGGVLKVRDVIKGKTVFAETNESMDWAEKINQIRVYSGEKFETLQAAEAGVVCAVTGLSYTCPGEGLGEEKEETLPLLEPVLTYRVILPPEVSAQIMLPKLKLIEEEEPKLHVVWEEQLKEIQVRVMGEVQLEILQRMIKDRFGMVVEFGDGSVVYKETIKKPVIGVGHFEPLRHYAEVHLLLEPGEPGSGLTFATDCSEDVLKKNWQRLILTHLEERKHRGVLTGAQVTDMKITLIAGRAHLKHTEGGDFRQATYRAVRQGLMEAESVLLEPFYAFRLEVPEKMTGRAMTDMERRNGRFDMPLTENGNVILTGLVPACAVNGYQKEVLAYTQGKGRFSCELEGYYPCHNTEEVLETSRYNPEEDVRNPADSVFCAHGAGFVVPWYEVKEYAHLETALGENAENDTAGVLLRNKLTEGITGERTTAMSQTGSGKTEDRTIGTEEIDAILERTFYANKQKDDGFVNGWQKRKRRENKEAVIQNFTPAKKKEPYLLVDGYNIIFAWEELKEIATVSLDGARGRLMDILCDYQATAGVRLILVFDAYRLKGHATEVSDYHNIHVVYTKEAETADCYIEKFAHENAGKYDVTVATSDGLEQIIIRGQGCKLLSAGDFLAEVERARKKTESF